MSSPTNLTDNITRLHKREERVNIAHIDTSSKTSRPKKYQTMSRERRFATDFFMFFAYSLLGVALLAQIFLIVWLDIFK